MSYSRQKGGAACTGWTTVLFILVAVLVVVSAPARAQSAKVYGANSSNGNIYLVGFTPPGVTVVNDDASMRTAIRALAIRDDGVDGLHLIVCDTGGGDVLFYENASGSGQVITSASSGSTPSLPDGVSLDADGNIFLVSSGPGAASTKVAEVWTILRDSDCPDPMRGDCLAGGYRRPLGLIDGSVEAQTEIDGHPATLEVDQLEETLVALAAGGAIGAGDLLALSRSPAALLRYPADQIAAFVASLAGGGSPAQIDPIVLIHPPGSSMPAAQRFPAGSAPGGMAFSPDGNLLFTTEGGEILIYGPDGVRRDDGMGGFIDFASGLGNGKFKIAVGPQNAEFRAFVVNRNGGDVLRFTINTDGTGLLDAEVTRGVQSPVGVATTTSNSVDTPVGTGVTVTPSGILTSTFEQVEIPGVTNISVFLFADPREDEVVVPFDQPLHRALNLQEISLAFPDRLVPPHIRAFRKDDPMTGVPLFILALTDTTADFSGIIDHLVDAEPILGYDVDCEAPDPFAQPHIYWTPDDLEPAIQEGDVFIDITTRCGSHRGLTRDFSAFLPVVRDVRPLAEIAETQLVALEMLHASSSCIQRKVGKLLGRILGTARRALDRGRIADVLADLETFVVTIEANPGAFGSCPDHVGGELRSRGQSAIFAFSKLL